MTRRAASRSFLVLAANTPWVYALAHSLVDHGAVTAVRFYDWANYRRLKPEWPKGDTGMRRVMLRLPRGYAGRLEPLFRLPMRAIIDRERRRLRTRSGSEPIVVCPYPYLAPWVRQVPGEHLVYYNLDDYVLYDPGRAARTTKLENELVQRAALTLCLSARQAQSLRDRNPSVAARIEHFPLGVVEEFLNPAPDRAPLPRTVGYVGNLTDRVDWPFVARVAELMPETRFHFVGNAADGLIGRGLAGTAAWQSERARSLAMPNVVHEGPIPQAAVPEHYWRYAVNWMPYDVRHPFNVAACPTKIMDALASGRPFVTTDMPEVRLYPESLHIVATAEEAASKLRALLEDDATHDARAQVEFASSQTWPHRARRFVELLPSSHQGSSRASERANEPIGLG
jgi:teichuronic acid biosynthesis glycosyltransferase TuaH